VIGLGVDTTARAHPVDAKNVPLALSPKWEKNLHAQCWLWKDHTSWREARKSPNSPRLIAAVHAKCGNTTSEWFWSKIWHCRNVAPRLNAPIPGRTRRLDSSVSPERPRRSRWFEASALPTQGAVLRQLGGLPDKEFLTLPILAGRSSRPPLHQGARRHCQRRKLSPAWAKKLGLLPAFHRDRGMDVHYGAIGCGVSEGTLVKVIGTSTCDCGVVPLSKNVRTFPASAGSFPARFSRFYGIEAASLRSAIFQMVGRGRLRRRCGASRETHAEVAKQKPGGSGLLALDWQNGNRTILVDPLLTGALIGTTLHTTQAEIYRALIEATAFGARAILERIRDYGVPIDRVVCAGGIAEKNALLMQIYADVTGCTMLVAGRRRRVRSARRFPRVLAGAHPDFPTAQRKMTSLKKSVQAQGGRAQNLRPALRAVPTAARFVRRLNKSADLSQ